jgi:hypothetical protein
LANSASVFSPLIAASATFALKPGLCVRRARFVILAPDLRHLRRCQAETPLTGLSEFPEPPLTATLLVDRAEPESAYKERPLLGILRVERLKIST